MEEPVDLVGLGLGFHWVLSSTSIQLEEELELETDGWMSTCGADNS